jgi:hypothetical protein
MPANHVTINKSEPEWESEQVILKTGKYDGQELTILKGMRSVCIPEPLTCGQWKYYRTSDIDDETGRTIFR